MLRWAVLVMCLVGWWVPQRGWAQTAGADDPARSGVATVEQLIDRGKRAYQAGRPREAADLLQQAIQLIQQGAAQSLAAFLPQLPPGWTGEEPQTTTGSWGAGEQAFQWTQVSRRYQAQGSQASASVTITNSPQLLEAQQGMVAAFSNPQMLAMMNQNPDQQIEAVERDGWTGWKTIQPGNTQVFAIRQGWMVMVNVDDATPAAVDSLWGALDLAGLAQQE